MKGGPSQVYAIQVQTRASCQIPGYKIKNIWWYPYQLVCVIILTRLVLRSYAKRRDSTHITPFTDRRGYAQWPSSLVWTCSETRCNQRHPQSDGAGNTRYQTTRAPQEDMPPTDEGRHGGRGCYPRCGPRPEGVEKEDKADPYEIGKKPPR